MIQGLCQMIKSLFLPCCIWMFPFLIFFPPPAFMRYNWHITLHQHKVCNLVTCLHIYWEMFTTIRLVNISIAPHSYHFFFVCMVRTFQFYLRSVLRSISNFRVYHTVLLTIVTMLYVISPELIHLITGSLYPLTTFFPHPQPPQPSTTKYNFCFYEFDFISVCVF